MRLFRHYCQFCDILFSEILFRQNLQATFNASETTGRSLAAAIYLVGEAMSVVDFWSERGDEMSLRAANVVKLNRK